MDAVILENVLGSIHNWFVRDTIQVTDCVISDGSIGASIQDGVWYRIQGSYLNDGMHLHGSEDEGLEDETFSGTITLHVIPRPLLSLCEEISEWQDKYGATINSPYQSESFGGYSYSKRGTGQGSGESASPGGWQSVFAASLNQWRKLS